MGDFHGSIGPVELKKHYLWNRWQGWTVAESWKGRQSEVKNYFASLKARGALDVRQEPLSDEGETQWWKITATFGKTSDIEDAPKEAESVWTLTGNDIESSIWRLPVVRSVLEPIFVSAPDTFQAYKEDVLAIVGGTKKFSEVSWYQALVQSYYKDGVIHWGEAGVATSVNLTLLALTYALMRNEEAYPLSQWVLRKTQVIEPDSAVALPFEDSNKIFTLEGLFVREDKPPDNPIPATLKTDLTKLGGFWLKRTPSKEPTGNGKYNVSVEWWYGTEFDTFIYGEALTA